MAFAKSRFFRFFWWTDLDSCWWSLIFVFALSFPDYPQFFGFNGWKRDICWVYLLIHPRRWIFLVLKTFQKSWSCFLTWKFKFGISQKKHILYDKWEAHIHTPLHQSKFLRRQCLQIFFPGCKKYKNQECHFEWIFLQKSKTNVGITWLIIRDFTTAPQRRMLKIWIGVCTVFLKESALFMDTCP